MKVNIEEKTRELNKFRMSFQNKTFSFKELKNHLKEITTNSGIIYNLLKLFPSEKIGRNVFYKMPENPIHISFVQKAWDKQREYQRRYNKKKYYTSEEDALNILRSKGYEIRKPKYFDETKFAKEHPELYKEYLVYERYK